MYSLRAQLSRKSACCSDASAALCCSQVSPPQAPGASAETLPGVCLCDPGYTGTIAGPSSTCTICPPAQYKSVSGTAGCVACSGGSMTDTLENPGAVSCRGCAAGRFNDLPTEPCMCRDSGVSCRWSKLLDMPATGGFVFGHTAAAAQGALGSDQVLVFGGLEGGKMAKGLMLYQPAEDSWVR